MGTTENAVTGPETSIPDGTKPASALFLHIQKTAGTSIVQTASRFYGTSLISHVDHRGRSPEEFRETGFVSGHFGFDYARPLMTSRYSFTFLRDPVERVLSFYYFCRRSDPDQYLVYRLAREKTMDAFLDMAEDHPQVRSYIWNHQAWQLACGWDNPGGKSLAEYDPKRMLKDAKAHLAGLDYIGFMETFDRDLARIFKALGILCPEGFCRTNVGEPKPRAGELPLSTRQRLQRMTRLDQALYDYARFLRWRRLWRPANVNRALFDYARSLRRKLVKEEPCRIPKN